MLGLAILSICTQSMAADETVVPSRWKIQEINYSYIGFTTAYDCDSAARKLKRILETLGAHPDTQVRTAGCPTNRPSRNFFIMITAVIPVPADELKLTSADQSRQELLKRLGVRNQLLDVEFPGTWKSVDLPKERRLDIRPGDCELIEGLRDKVLPKLNVKIEYDKVKCMPNRIGIQPPQLRVSALVQMQGPDTKSE
jgi:hypothetical protein